MGLFDKKYCDICGQPIKLLGNRKCEDGNICKDCVSKLSPYFSERKRSTVQDIRDQLAYREANKEALKDFSPTLILDGDDKKIYIDEKAEKMIVTSTDKWRNYNPDIIDLAMVSDVRIACDEHESEIKAKDPEGKQVGTGEYEYEYSFRVTLYVKHPYFDDISYDLCSYSNRPKSPYDDDFNYYCDLANYISQVLVGREWDIDVRKFRYRYAEPEEVIIINEVHVNEPNIQPQPRIIQPQQPVYQQPVYQQPVYQQPVQQQPVYQQPVYQQQVQQTVYQQPVQQTVNPVQQQPVRQSTTTTVRTGHPMPPVRPTKK